MELCDIEQNNNARFTITWFVGPNNDTSIEYVKSHNSLIQYARVRNIQSDYRIIDRTLFRPIFFTLEYFIKPEKTTW